MNKDFKDIFFSGRHYSARLILINDEIILIKTPDIHEIPNEIRSEIKYLFIYDTKTKEYKKIEMN